MFISKVLQGKIDIIKVLIKTNNFTTQNLQNKHMKFNK